LVGASRTGVIATTVVSSRAALAAARSTMDGRVGVVMTMGALHAGHASLIRRARADTDHVIVTIFVNPLQFGPTEDFARYPRTLDADVGICRAAGVDVVFTPDATEVYPQGRPRVRVEPGPQATILEGASRPGHFDGVLTVVLKLLNLTGADVAYFGEKDYQQLTLIRAMVSDLDVPVRIVGVDTVREPDGLALSSRNRYLTADQRTLALALVESLRAGARSAQRGADPGAVLAAAREELSRTQAVVADYLELTDEWLGPPQPGRPARLLVAARVGTTRLIDNVGVALR
jgi:pantoate--beta-alanine ligase